MEFFNNKENDILKFKLNSEGIDVNNIEPRLIFTTSENKNYLLIGKVENDMCKFNIPQLSIYEKGDNGKIRFEIISEDLYFPVWNDDFEIKTKVNITLEKMITDIQNDTVKDKPKISVSEAKIEVQQKPIQQKIESEIIKEKKSDIETETTYKQILSEKKTTQEEETETKKDNCDTTIDSTKPTIKKFDSFF